MSFNLPEHAANDAFVLRNRRVPECRRAEIVAFHAAEIERQAHKDKQNQVWHEGQLSPKALLAAEYINAMFIEAHRGRPIVSSTAVAEIYGQHIDMIKNGEIMASNPLGYTALSALSFAADKVQGIADRQGIAAYICQPEDVNRMDMAS